MRCSMTASFQANNAPDLVQYSCKLRDAEQDKTFVPHIHVCVRVHSCFRHSFVNSGLKHVHFCSSTSFIFFAPPDVLQWWISDEVIQWTPVVIWQISKLSTVGSNTSISAAPLDEFYLFFHYPDVLQWSADEVFSNPRVPFDKMSLHPQEAKWLKFRDQEIVRLQFLENFP